jgi:molecular chaperone GrpE
MKNPRKKAAQQELPEQDAMGSEDDFAPGGNAQSTQADGVPPSEGSGPADVGSDQAVAADVTSDLSSEREKFLRLAAEYDNYRKRSVRERSEVGARAQADLVRQMVEGLDDLARFAHVDPSTTDAETIVQGVDMVEKKIMKALSSAGLRVINPVGETFDPSLHEAVATEPTSAQEDDHVVARVYQPGYVFNTQLIRPARVVVKQWNG